MGSWGGYGFKSGTLVARGLYVYREWSVQTRGVWESWLWRVYPFDLDLCVYVHVGGILELAMSLSQSKCINV